MVGRTCKEKRLEERGMGKEAREGGEEGQGERTRKEGSGEGRGARGGGGGEEGPCRGSRRSHTRFGGVAGEGHRPTLVLAPAVSPGTGVTRGEVALGACKALGTRGCPWIDRFGDERKETGLGGQAGVGRSAEGGASTGSQNLPPALHTAQV